MFGVSLQKEKVLGVVGSGVVCCVGWSGWVLGGWVVFGFQLFVLSFFSTLNSKN